MNPKSIALALTFLAGILLCAHPLRSQVTPPPTTIQQLHTMKDQNDKLIQQQEATMQKLDELLKDAQQLRIFVRRT